jgi:hypothetical protein
MLEGATWFAFNRVGVPLTFAAQNKPAVRTDADGD